MENLSNKIPKFEDVFSFGSLLKSWQEFKKRKINKPDVADFGSCLISNLWNLYADIASGNYRHGGYKHFKINDPKPRDIHKALVRDRIVHHAIYRALYPHFESDFIFDSYACRDNKGHHRALRRFGSMIKNESCANRKTVWVLKCDIKKFFSSIDHEVLSATLRNQINCPKMMRVITEVLESFKPGLPLGNLTSQLFGNIYMNTFDHYLVKVLQVRSYIRYADDFVILSVNRPWLEELLPQIGDFLTERLNLELRLDKVHIRTVAFGIDFLGWIHFNNFRVLRRKTKERMLVKYNQNLSWATLNSYRGHLRFGNGHKLTTVLESLYEQGIGTRE